MHSTELVENNREQLAQRQEASVASAIFSSLK